MIELNISELLEIANNIQSTLELANDCGTNPFETVE